MKWLLCVVLKKHDWKYGLDMVGGLFSNSCEAYGQCQRCSTRKVVVHS